MDFDAIFLQVKELCTARFKDFYEERMASKDAEIAQLQEKLSRSEYLVDKYRTSMQAYMLVTTDFKERYHNASSDASFANHSLTTAQKLKRKDEQTIEALQWENDDLRDQVKSLELMLERHGFFNADDNSQLPEENNCSYDNDDYVEPSNSSNSNRNNSTRSLRYLNFSSDLPSILEEDEEEYEEEEDLSASVPQQPLPAIRSAIFVRKSLEGISANFINGSPSATSSPIFIKKDCTDKNSEQKKPGFPFANAITIKSLETPPAVAMNHVEQLPKPPSPLPAAPKKESIASSQLTPPLSPLPTASKKECIVEQLPSLTTNGKQEQLPKPSPTASEKKCIVEQLPSLTTDEKQEQPSEPLPAGNKKRIGKKDKKSKSKPRYSSFYSFAIY